MGDRQFRRGGRVWVEPLEDRCLRSSAPAAIAVNVSIGPLAPALGGEVATANVTLTNTGATRVGGTWGIDMVLQVGTPVPMDDPVGSATVPLHLGAGRSRTVRVKLQFPNSVPDGTDTIYAAAGNNLDSTHPSVQSPKVPVTIRHAAVPLTGQFLTEPTYTIGQTAAVSIRINNQGAVRFTGGIRASVILSAQPNSNGEIGDIPALFDRGLSLRPGGSAVLRARVPVMAQLHPGAYYFVASVGPRSGLQNATLFQVVSAPVQLIAAPTHGLFALPSHITVADARAVTTADFNGDGNADIAVGDGNGVVQVVLGNGDGTFRPPVNTVVDPAHPDRDTVVSIVAADFNGDGHIDLAVGGLIQGGQNVLILLGNGDGTFRPGTTMNAGTGSLVAADFNGDGKMDLITADDDLPPVYGVELRLGNGDGTFQPPRQIDSNFVAQTPQALVTGDFNRDGHPDIAVVSVPPGAPPTDFEDVSVFVGLGNGTFSPPTIVATGGYAGSLAVADLNGDGFPDLATANDGNGDASVVLNDRHGSFRLAGVYDVHSSAVSIAAASAAGRPADVLVGNNFVGISEFRNTGKGALRQDEFLAQMSDPLDMAVADFNHDGKQDIVAVGGSDLAIFLHN